MDILKELESLKLYHYHCEDDPWFSCPKTGHCCRETLGDECNCGAEKHNEKLDEVIKELKCKLEEIESFKIKILNIEEQKIKWENRYNFLLSQIYTVLDNVNGEKMKWL